jgi:class 3 adenylate cyclase
MTGGTQLIYDVWGPTVSIAHLLARSAGGGQIVVSDATHRALPDSIECVVVDDLDDADGSVWRVVGNLSRGAV